MNVTRTQSLIIVSMVKANQSKVCDACNLYHASERLIADIVKENNLPV